VLSVTTHTARCGERHCRWAKTFNDLADAKTAQKAHAHLHTFKVGDEVMLEGVWRGVIKHIYYDQDRVHIEERPQRKGMCYSCPKHDEHWDGSYISHSGKISQLVMTRISGGTA